MAAGRVKPSQPLFGIETEYSLVALDCRGRPIAGEEVVNDLLARARKCLVGLPDRSGSGLFLANAQRFYIDCGSHPEVATAECGHPDDLVLQVRAGDSIVERLVRQLVASRDDIHTAYVLRGNVDYADHDTCGSHENYSYRSSFDLVAAQLVPHLASRVVFTGSGGFVNRPGHHIDYSISPRAWHLHGAVGGPCHRSIVDGRDEPHAATGVGRLHLTCGETLCSPSALWLRVATTALVIAVIDHGIGAGDAVMLRDPVAAMRSIAADPTCRVGVETLDGRRLTAIDIQRHYCSLVERSRGGDFMPPWAGEVCERWRAVLDRLDGGAAAVATELDWAMKYVLYRRFAEQRGFDWDTLPRRVELSPPPSADEGGGFRCRIGEFVHRFDWSQPVASAMSRLEDEGRGFASAEVAAEAPPVGISASSSLRDQLYELDTHFATLGYTGVYTSLEAAGLTEPFRLAAADIERAAEYPPSGSRAAVRGDWVRRLHDRRSEFVCDWAGVWDRGRERWLDLSDPLQTSAAWRPFAMSESLRPVAYHSHPRRDDFAEGERWYRAGDFEESARSFRLVGAEPRGLDVSHFARRHFWAATHMHNMGFLTDAQRTLENLTSLALPVEWAYKAHCRLALIRLERGRPLAEIDAALAAWSTSDGAAADAALRSRVTLAKARILHARGLHAESIAAAEDALELLASDPFGMAMVTHERSLLAACRSAGDWVRAARWAEQDGAASLPVDVSREILLACTKSELARARGYGGEAIGLAREAAAALRRENESLRASRVWVAEAVIRALLCLGDWNAARDDLRQAGWMIESESPFERYAVLLMWADGLLGRACRSVGLPFVDPVTGRSFRQRPPARLGHHIVRRSLRLAHTYYGRAAEAGRTLDRSLACTERADEVGRRLARLGAVELAIARRIDKINRRAA